MERLLTACKAALGGRGLFGVTYIDPAETDVIVSATVLSLLSTSQRACEKKAEGAKSEPWAEEEKDRQRQLTESKN
jgi:hypothetical protein